MLLGDEAPAGAARFAAGLGIGAPNGVEQGPVDERRYRLPKDQQHTDRQNRAGAAGKQVVAQPLHRSAIRALYQFMNAEIERLMVRYTAMMIATPSIACPVWFRM